MHKLPRTQQACVIDFDVDGCAEALGQEVESVAVREGRAQGEELADGSPGRDDNLLGEALDAELKGTRVPIVLDGHEGGKAGALDGEGGPKDHVVLGVAGVVAEQVSLQAEDLAARDADAAIAIARLDPVVGRGEAVGPVLLLVDRGDAFPVLRWQGVVLDLHLEVAVRRQRVDVPVQGQGQMDQGAFGGLHVGHPRGPGRRLGLEAEALVPLVDAVLGRRVGVHLDVPAVPVLLECHIAVPVGHLQPVDKDLALEGFGHVMWYVGESDVVRPLFGLRHAAHNEREMGARRQLELGVVALKG